MTYDDAPFEVVLRYIIMLYKQKLDIASFCNLGVTITDNGELYMATENVYRKVSKAYLEVLSISVMEIAQKGNIKIIRFND